MNAQLIAIDANALAKLCKEVSRLHERLDAVDITPRPEWVTVGEFAQKVDRSPRTVTRWIDAGQVESKTIAGVRMVRSIEAFS